MACALTALLLRHCQKNTREGTTMILEILRITNMHHERDRQAVLAAIARIPGIHRAHANAASGTLQLEREARASLTAIIRALEAAGYQVAVLA
ncbi:MAG: copper chaperone [Candidatus Viridilinea halotolerans]|uniref:Copper chaperone n=1 Tax=Candidatus Viridilinea halotolerans TaxID=2491704 RepID=A0A426TUG8_9CHLR|nr:MAG: copper chaperone [Candidatus Viridilinea halotolerans]